MGIFCTQSTLFGQFSWPSSRRLALACGVLFALGLLFASAASGQGNGIGSFGTLGGVEPGGRYPARQYYLALEIYRSGDLVNATEAMEMALRSGRRDVNGRWIDSIPALAMLAECYWHLGNVPASKQYCDQVFDIAIRHQGWLSRIDWSTAVQGNTIRSKPQWLWPEAAAVTVAPVSERITFASGAPLTEQRIAQGGVIEELNLRAMD